MMRHFNNLLTFATAVLYTVISVTMVSIAARPLNIYQMVKIKNK